MRKRSWNDGMPRRRTPVRISRHVCTWVSFASLVGCAVGPLDQEDRACPCIPGWVCDEPTQICVLPTQSGFEPPNDDERWDSEPRDASVENPPFSRELVDAATVTDAELNVPRSDAGQVGSREDGGLVDADTPDAAHDDAGQTNLDAGSEPCKQTMLAAERKEVGEYLCSSNGQYRFGLNPGGDLELRMSQSVIWSSETCCGVRLAMQRDGNMVVYNQASTAVFATHTAGNDGAFLRVEDDGRAVLWLGGKVVWSTATK